MNTMEYKGFAARIEFDGEDELFVGRLLGLRAIVSFHADTVAKLKREMHAAVVPLRMPPEIHGRAAVMAEASGKSLNQLITDLVEKATSRARGDAPTLMQTLSRSMRTTEFKPKKASTSSATVSAPRRPARRAG